MQRVTAVALVPLLLWFVLSLTAVVGADYAIASEWLRRPFNAALMIALVGCLFYHAHLGLRVVIEDYVHAPALKVTTLLVLKFALAMLALVALLAVVRIYLGG